MDTNSRPLAVSRQQGVANRENALSAKDRLYDSGIYRFYCIVQEPYFLTMQTKLNINILNCVKWQQFM